MTVRDHVEPGLELTADRRPEVGGVAVASPLRSASVGSGPQPAVPARRYSALDHRVQQQRAQQVAEERVLVAHVAWSRR